MNLSEGTAANDAEMGKEVVRATIVSRHFWPPFHNEQLTLHKRAAKTIKAFSENYTKLKNPRQLLWKPHIGTVELQLDFDDGKGLRDFTTTPLMANVIMHFEDQKKWPLADLSAILALKPELLRKKITYWMNQGVIRQYTEGSNNALVYELNANPEEATEQMGMGDEEESGATVSADAQAEEEMKVYESYVTGMLTNFGALPADRIHNMLKMFVAGGDHTYDKSLQQLGAFLQKLVSDDRLECSGGMYSLNKS